MPQTVFVCPNNKCAYAIDADALNQVQLKVLRRTAKICPNCNQMAMFTEQTSLLNTQTNTQTLYGGVQHENNQKVTTSNRKKMEQEGRAGDGYFRL